MGTLTSHTKYWEHPKKTYDAPHLLLMIKNNLGKQMALKFINSFFEKCFILSAGLNLTLERIEEDFFFYDEKAGRTFNPI